MDLSKRFALVAFCISMLVSSLSSFAQAQSPQTLLLCTGSSVTYYNPGLLLTPREIELSWTDTYSTCLPNDSNIGSGITTGSAISEISCVSLLGEESAGSQRIDWNNGQYSVMSWAAEDVIISGAPGTQIYTVNATITEGLFLGSRVTEEIVTTTPNLLNCLSEPGVTSTNGLLALLIESLI